MIARFLLTLTLLTSAASLHGSDEKTTVPLASSFTANTIARDPFERIDAKYLAERNAVVLPFDPLAGGDLRKLVRVTAISIDRLCIAVINGKAFAEKETFTVKTKEKEIRVTLLKVTKSGVELNCGGTILTAPIFRENPSLLDDTR